MIIALILAAIILVPVLWIVVVPVDIRVNTANGLYEVRQPGTITISLHPGEIPLVKIRVLGFLMDTQRRQNVTGREEEKPGKAARKSRKSFAAWHSLLSGVIKSFHCRRFVCDIDFDDVVLNAQLVPINYFVSRGAFIFNVNFNRNYLFDIWMQARLHRMLWPFIRFYLTK